MRRLRRGGNDATRGDNVQPTKLGRADGYPAQYRAAGSNPASRLFDANPTMCDRCQRLIETLRWVKLMIRPKREGGYRDWKTIMFVVEAELNYYQERMEADAAEPPGVSAQLSK